MIVYGYIGPVGDAKRGHTIEAQRRLLERHRVRSPYLFEDNGGGGRERWRALNSQLQAGDVLVVVSINQLGRRISDRMGALARLLRLGVRVQTLAESEHFLRPYLEARPNTPEREMASTLAGLMEQLVEADRQGIAGRTKQGMENAKGQGKRMGPRPKYNEMVRRAIRSDRAAGKSWGQIKQDWGVARSTAQRIVGEVEAEEPIGSEPVGYNEEQINAVRYAAIEESRQRACRQREIEDVAIRAVLRAKELGAPGF